jgi:hypothetical protein
MRQPDRLQLPMLIIILFLFSNVTYRMFGIAIKIYYIWNLIICLAEKWYSKYI